MQWSCSSCDMVSKEETWLKCPAFACPLKARLEDNCCQRCERVEAECNEAHIPKHPARPQGICYAGTGLQHTSPFVGEKTVILLSRSLRVVTTY